MQHSSSSIPSSASRGLAWGAIAALLAVGCGPVALNGAVDVPHPRRAEIQAPATQVAIDATDVERAWGLPDASLVDRAALLRADDEHVCVQLALWALPREQSRIDFDRYGIEVTAVGAGARRRAGDPTVTNVRSWSEQRNRTQYNYWRGNVTVPTPVSYRAGDLCFASDAPLVDEETEELWLTLRAGGREQRFKWRFAEDAVYPEGVGAGDAVRPRADDPMPQQMGGYATATAGGMGAGTGLGSGQVIQRVPGGHPVDVAWLEQLFESRFGSLRMCLSRAAEQDPRLNRMRGQMVAEFTVGPSGMANVRVVGNDFTPAAATCMREHLEAMPVPADPMRWTSLFRYVIGTGPAPGGAR